MHTGEYDYLFKLLLIGDSGVGKVRPLHKRHPLLVDFLSTKLANSLKTVLLAPSIR
jgi:hypothetical protein